MILYIAVLICAVVIGYLLWRYNKLFPILTILTSGIERLYIDIGFSLSPIILISIAAIPAVFRSLKTTYRQAPKGLYLSLAAIILSAFLSNIHALSHVQSLKSAIFVILYATVVLGEYSIITQTKYKERVFIAITISLLLFSLYSLLQYVLFHMHVYPDLFDLSIPRNSALTPLDFVINNDLRPNSGFNDVNTAAGFLMLYLPFLFYYTYKLYRNKARFFPVALIASIVSFLALVLTHSRSIILAVIVVLFVVIIYAMIKYKSIRQWFSFGLLASALLAGVIGFHYKDVIQSKVNQTYTNEYSLYAHITYTQSALRAFQSDPFTGRGIGSFYDYFKLEMKEGKVGYFNSVDNPPLYIKYLAEEGIVGLIGNLLLLGYVMFVLYKKALEQEKFFSYSLVFLIGFAGVLGANVLHAYLPLYFSAVFIGTSLAIVDTAGKSSSGDDK